MYLVTVCLIFVEGTHCYSAEHQLHASRDLSAHSVEGHGELFERTESQMSIIELTEVSVCLLFIFCFLLYFIRLSFPVTKVGNM